MNLLFPQLEQEHEGLTYIYTASFDSDGDGLYCDDAYDIEVYDDGEQVKEPFGTVAFLMRCEVTKDYLHANYNDILGELEEKQTTDRIEW